MQWLATFAALLLEKLAPWIWGLIGTGITAVVGFFAKKQHDASEAKQREEATLAEQKAIADKAARDERQKREQDLLNS